MIGVRFCVLCTHQTAPFSQPPRSANNVSRETTTLALKQEDVAIGVCIHTLRPHQAALSS